VSEPTGKHRRTLGRVEDAALAASFLVAIWLPLAGMILSRDAAAGSAEKRNMAAVPPRPRGWRELADFPVGFGKYFKDNFGFRRELIGWHASWKVKWLRVSTSPDVLIGKDGWLFYAGDGTLGSDNSLPPFTPGQLAHWRSVIEARRDWLKRRGIGYLFVIVPEKHTIYPEYMPPGAGGAGKQSRLDQLTAHLRENSDLEVVDLRPALRRAKTAHEVYLRTDTHWNGRGAFASYQAIVGELSKSFPAVEPMSAADCTVTTRPFSEGDLAFLMGLGNQYGEEAPYVAPRVPAFRLEGDLSVITARPVISERAGAGLPRLVMFRDSFATALIPLLSQHFSRAVYSTGYQHRFDPALVERERPDVVLQEMGERFLALDPPAEVLPNP